MKYKCPGIYCSKDLDKEKVWKCCVKVGHTTRSKGQIWWYPKKGHKKYACEMRKSNIH